MTTLLISLDKVIGNVTNAPANVNSGVSPIGGSGGVTVLILLDIVIGNVTNAPVKVNSGVSPIGGSGGVTVLILLDIVIGKSTMPPFNIIGGEDDRPVSAELENCASNGISRWSSTSIINCNRIASGYIRLT